MCISYYRVWQKFRGCFIQSDITLILNIHNPKKFQKLANFSETVIKV